MPFTNYEIVNELALASRNAYPEFESTLEGYDKPTEIVDDNTGFAAQIYKKTGENQGVRDLEIECF